MQEPWPLQLSGQWGALDRREGLWARSEEVAKTDTTDSRTVVVWSILVGGRGWQGWEKGRRGIDAAMGNFWIDASLLLLRVFGAGWCFVFGFHLDRGL